MSKCYSLTFSQIQSSSERIVPIEDDNDHRIDSFSTYTDNLVDIIKYRNVFNQFISFRVI